MAAMALITVRADYRERPSGVPALLSQLGVKVAFEALPAGDYVMGNDIVVERKTATDFVQSLVAGRLFAQCVALCRSGYRPFLMVEGDVHHSGHDISTNAIIGALISVMTAWQVSVLYVPDAEASAQAINILARQMQPQYAPLRKIGLKPKRLQGKKLAMLQTMPHVGPKTAQTLLQKLGNLKNVLNADIQQLMSVEGVGRKTATGIVEFLNGDV